MHLIGHHAARRFLNFKLGWQMFRDPQVPIYTKAAALSVGAVITILLMICEIPLEGLLGLLSSCSASIAVSDVMFDGAEPHPLAAPYRDGGSAIHGQGPRRANPGSGPFDGPRHSGLTHDFEFRTRLVIETLIARGCRGEDVFDSHAEVARKVDPRLDAEAISRLENNRALRHQVGHLVTL